MTLTVSEQHNLQSTLSPINSRATPCESSSSPMRLRTEACAHGAASGGSMAEKKNGLLVPGRRGVHPSTHTAVLRISRAKTGSCLSPQFRAQHNACYTEPPFGEAC